MGAPPEPPLSTPPPGTYPQVTGEAWIAEAMMQMQSTLAELRSDANHLKTTITNHENAFRSDFRWTWGGIAAAVVLLMSALIFGYFKLDDKQSASAIGQARIETKIDYLMNHPSTLNRQPNTLPAINRD
jgi:hypothetical protein